MPNSSRWYPMPGQSAAEAWLERCIEGARQRSIREPYNQQAWAQFVELIKQRTPAQIRRMERAQGLAP